MFGDLSNPSRENFCVTENGDILALSIYDGVFVYKDGFWVKPSFEVFGSTLHDSRVVTDEEWESIQKTLKGLVSQDSEPNREIAPEIKAEFIKIAKEYNYPDRIMQDVLSSPGAMSEILDAKRRGCNPDASWAQSALMCND